MKEASVELNVSQRYAVSIETRWGTQTAEPVHTL